MNADPEFDALQSTLRKFPPAPLPEDLRRDLESAAPSGNANLPIRRLDRAPSSDNPSPLSDRLLALWTTAGALAACLVLALTVWQLSATPRRAPASPQDLTLHQQTAQELQRLIASR
jgi:hypothetical protein